MYSFRSQQSNALRHFKTGSIVRVERLVSKRPYHDIIDSKSWKAVRRNPTTRQEKARPTDPLINYDLTISLIDDGIPRVKHLRSVVLLALQTRQITAVIDSTNRI